MFLSNFQQSYLLSGCHFNFFKVMQSSTSCQADVKLLKVFSVLFYWSVFKSVLFFTHCHGKKYDFWTFLFFRRIFIYLNRSENMQKRPLSSASKGSAVCSESSSWKRFTWWTESRKQSFFYFRWYVSHQDKLKDDLWVL